MLHRVSSGGVTMNSANIRGVSFALLLPIVTLFVVLSGGAGAQYKSASEIPAEVFAKLPAVSELSLSPSGKYIAMMQPYQGRNALIVQLRGSAAAEDMSFYPAPEPYSFDWFKWKSDDHLLVSIRFAGLRRAGPTVETRLISLDRAAGEFTYIVKAGKKVNQTGGRLSGVAPVAQLQDDVINFLWDDPEHILLSLDSNRDGEYEVRYLSIIDGEFRERGNGFRGIQNWITDKQGVVRYGDGFDGKKIKRYYKSPNTERLSNFEDTEAFKNGLRLWEFDEDPNLMFMSGVSEYGTDALFKYDMSANTIIETYHSDPDYSVSSLVHEPWTDRVIGYSYVSDTVEKRFFDEGWKRRQAVVDRALKDTVNTFVSSTKDHTLHVILSESDIESGIYYLYDEAEKSIALITPRYVAFDPILMAPVKRVTYAARDGLEIPAYLTLPKNTEAQNLPTVILPHGGPHSRDYKNFDYWAQFLASRGYAVLQPNFRGSSGYKRSFEAAGRNNWGLKMQDDVTDGLKWMINEGIADKDRICMMGGSYGGYAALMASVKTPDLLKCAISINGVSDLVSMIYEDKKFIGGGFWTESVGTPGKDRNVLRQTSPRQQIDKIGIPILLVHTKDDRRVPFSHSRNMARALRKEKKPYEFIEIETGDHQLTTETARQETLVAVEAFLAKYLK